MKFINNLKSIFPKKPIQSNTPPTSIATLCKPSSTRNNKNSDDFTNNIQMVRSKTPKEIPQRCEACNYRDHYKNSKKIPMTAKTMNTNNTQDSSQVVPATPTPMRFINIEHIGASVYAEFSTTDGQF